MIATGGGGLDTVWVIIIDGDFLLPAVPRMTKSLKLSLNLEASRIQAGLQRNRIMNS